MKKKERIKKSIECLTGIILMFKNETFDKFSELRCGVSNCFFVSNDIFHEVFFDIFSFDEMSEFSNALNCFTRESGLNYKNSYYPDIFARIAIILSNYNVLRNKKKISIFYSWQSDLANNTNRGFINAALEKSITELSKTYNREFIIDSDTRDEPGSPDIISTILKKIDECDIFISDVSIVTEFNGKFFPNSNVIFETGYAYSAKGSEYIIMVFNKSVFKQESLPFDINQKRLLSYECCKDDNEKGIKKEDLSKKLTRAIQIIIDGEGI